jgi:1,2-diacylglycerol 3-alpha-glucosyltransferase
MKILVTTPTFAPSVSGLANVAETQAIFLLSNGHEVTVATGGETRRSEVYKGLKVERFPISGEDSLLHPMKGALGAYADFLRNSRFDVTIFHAWQNWATDLPLRMLDQISGRKYLFSHCVSVNTWFAQRPLSSTVRCLAWRPYWWRMPKRMRQLDGMIFLDNAGCDERFDDLKLAQRLGIPHSIVPNHVSAWTLARHASGLEHRKALISVGSYDWQKGFDFVLQAYARSSARNRIPLDLYGYKRSAYVATLERLCRELALDPEFVRFNFGHAYEALETVYANASLFIGGSVTECQPLALLDAMGSGTPFVARATGCIPSLPGGVAIRTVAEAASAIDSFLADSSLWAAASRAGRDAATSRFDRDKSGQALLKAINL